MARRRKASCLEWSSLGSRPYDVVHRGSIVSSPPCGPAILPKPTPNPDVVFTTARKIARPGSADKAQVMGFSTHGDPTIGPAWFARTQKKICAQAAHEFTGLGDESWTAGYAFNTNRAPAQARCSRRRAIAGTRLSGRDVRAARRCAEIAPQAQDESESGNLGGDRPARRGRVADLTSSAEFEMDVD